MWASPTGESRGYYQRGPERRWLGQIARVVRSALKNEVGQNPAISNGGRYRGLPLVRGGSSPPLHYSRDLLVKSKIRRVEICTTAEVVLTLGQCLMRTRPAWGGQTECDYTSYMTTLLSKRNQGKVIDATSRHRVSNHFVRTGRYIRFADWCFIHRDRLDVLLDYWKSIWSELKNCTRHESPGYWSLKFRDYLLRHTTLVLKIYVHLQLYITYIKSLWETKKEEWSNCGCVSTFDCFGKRNMEKARVFFLVQSFYTRWEIQ